MCPCVLGMSIIAGIGVFEGIKNNYDTRAGAYQYGDGSEFASTIGVMAGVSAILGGMFCIFELLACS